MIDKFFYTMFEAIDNAFEWIDKKLHINGYERHKIIRKTQSRNTTKEKRN